GYGVRLTPGSAMASEGDSEEPSGTIEVHRENALLDSGKDAPGNDAQDAQDPAVRGAGIRHQSGGEAAGRSAQLHRSGGGDRGRVHGAARGRFPHRQSPFTRTSD